MLLPAGFLGVEWGAWQGEQMPPGKEGDGKEEPAEGRREGVGSKGAVSSQHSWQVGEGCPDPAMGTFILPPPTISPPVVACDGSAYLASFPLGVSHCPAFSLFWKNSSPTSGSGVCREPQTCFPRTQIACGVRDRGGS